MVRVNARADTVREMWLTVARTAAEHRRIVGAGGSIFYGDLSLVRTAEAHAWRELTTAVRRAVDARVDKEEIVDALRTGDPDFHRCDATELIDWVCTREDRLQELNDRILRDIFGEGD